MEERRRECGKAGFIFELFVSSLYKSFDKHTSVEPTANISETLAFNLVLAGGSTAAYRVSCVLFHMEFWLKIDFESVGSE